MTTDLNPVDNAELNSAGIAGFGLSYAITSIFSALLVVLKESSEPVHDALVAITGHHWVTHGVINLVIFVVLGFVLMRRSGAVRMAAQRLITIMVAATVLSGLIIAGYFV